MLELIPAIIPQDFEDLFGHAEAVVSSVKTIQVDVCDGIFVSNTSWPLKKDKGEFEKIINGDEGLPFWEKLDYEVDLMVEHPKDQAQKWILAGAKRIIFHIESVGVQEAFDFVKKEFKYQKGDDFLELGVAINLETPISALESVINDVSVVQCMGIARIGFQHEPYDARVLEKIKEIQAKYPEAAVSVDGGVDIENAKEILDAGATRLIAGHSVFQGELEPRDAILKFRSLL